MAQATPRMLQWFSLVVVALVAIGFLAFASTLVGAAETRPSGWVIKVALMQGIGVVVGVAMYVLLSRMPLSLLLYGAPIVYVTALTASLLTFMPGIGLSVGGAHRWVDLGFATLQPAEFLKGAAVLLAAWWGVAWRERGAWYVRLGWLGVFLLPAVVVLVLQRDSSNLFVTLAGVAVVVLLSSVPLIPALATLVGAAGALLVLLMVWRSDVLMRLKVFLGLIHDPLGASYQLEVAKIAIGSGQLWGMGIGKGVAKFGVLPQALNDAIFAVYAQEVGFIGSLVLIVLYMALVGILLWSAWKRAPQRPFASLLLAGVAAVVGTQALLNIGALLGLVPLSGMTLPLVSQGASSLIATLALLGIAAAAMRARRVVG